MTVMFPPDPHDAQLYATPLFVEDLLEPGAEGLEVVDVFLGEDEVLAPHVLRVDRKLADQPAADQTDRADLGPGHRAAALVDARSVDDEVRALGDEPPDDHDAGHGVRRDHQVAEEAPAAIHEHGRKVGEPRERKHCSARGQRCPAVAVQRPAERLMVIGWAKVAEIDEVVMTSSTGPAARSRPSRMRVAWVVQVGSSSR